MSINIAAPLRQGAAIFYKAKAHWSGNTILFIPSVIAMDLDLCLIMTGGLAGN